MKNAIIALLVLLAAALGAAQVDTTPPTDARPPNPNVRRHPDEQQIHMQQDQLKKLNSDRQKAIKKDTDKLLQLATELKQYVDKTNDNTLSLDVVKKAGEIEKLAKDVKEKMKTGY